MPTQAQTIVKVTLFDYEIANGVPQFGVEVKCQLISTSSVPLVASTPTANVPADQGEVRINTDVNGYWQFVVPSNNIITPAGSYYLVTTPFRSMRVAIPSGAGPFQASGNLAP